MLFHRPCRAPELHSHARPEGRVPARTCTARHPGPREAVSIACQDPHNSYRPHRARPAHRSTLSRVTAVKRSPQQLSTCTQSSIHAFRPLAGAQSSSRATQRRARTRMAPSRILAVLALAGCLLGAQVMGCMGRPQLRCKNELLRAPAASAPEAAPHAASRASAASHQCSQAGCLSAARACSAGSATATRRPNALPGCQTQHAFPVCSPSSLRWCTPLRHSGSSNPRAAARHRRHSAQRAVSRSSSSTPPPTAAAAAASCRAAASEHRDAAARQLGRRGAAVRQRGARPCTAAAGRRRPAAAAAARRACSRPVRSTPAAPPEPPALRCPAPCCCRCCHPAGAHNAGRHPVGTRAVHSGHPRQDQLGCGDGGVPSGGRVERRRPHAVHLGHVQPGAWQHPEQRHGCDVWARELLACGCAAPRRAATACWCGQLLTRCSHAAHTLFTHCCCDCDRACMCAAAQPQAMWRVTCITSMLMTSSS